MKAVRFCAGSLILLILSGLFTNLRVFGGYDSTYVLAVKQKYAIPENVVNGDYVGTWLKTWTWFSKGTISFAIEKNFNNAFSINPGSGLITIADYTKINGKIVHQDTVINLIIRTTDSNVGFELDTAQIWVKENAFCVFVDYSGNNGNGTRSSPKSSLENASISSEKMYCIKRGNVIKKGVTLLRSLVSSAEHPLILCTYGQGNKPKFHGGSEICFDMDTYNGESSETNMRSEYLFFYDIVVRDYAGPAYKVRRKGNHMGWYNCETYNCDREDIESAFIINTSSYKDTAVRYDFEIINYYADTTSYNILLGESIDGDSQDERAIGMRIEPSFIKTGVGAVNIINSYFGKTPGWAVRQGSGIASFVSPGSIMKHCYFNKQWSDAGNIDGRGYCIMVRQDNHAIEDCIIEGGNIGIFVTSAGDEFEMPPDNLVVKNCLIKNQKSYGIWLADNGTGYKPFYNTVIEDNYIENNGTGIREDKGVNTRIRRNTIIGGSGNGIINNKSSVNIGIHYNVISGFNGDEIYLQIGSGANLFNNTVDGEINCTGTSSSVARNNFYRTLTGISSQTNNLDIDAIKVSEYFEDYTGHDFRLKSTAIEAIEKGINVGLKSDASFYPVNGLPDIGAFEFKTTEKAVNNPPVIESREFQLLEKDFSNLYVGNVIAYDNDIGQQLTYSFLSGNESGLFEIDIHTGELRSTTLNIFGTGTTSYKLVVLVTDDGEEPKSNSATITVNLVEQPTVFYIDPNNKNDAAEDGSIAHPYDSWQDISWKEGNTYLQKKGTTAEVDKINIFSNNVELGAYGDGALPIITSETNAFIIRAYEKSGIIISNLHIIGRNAVSCIYFIGATSENITIEKCNFEGAVNGVRIVDGNNYVLRYNTFYNTQEAIYSYAQNTEIFYNIFTGNGSAINISSTASIANIYNNVFYDNRQGISNSYSELTLYNNIFYLTNAGDMAINNEVDNVISDFNIFYPEQTGFIKIGSKQFDNIAEYQNLKGVDLNSFSEDPKFADAYNMNFSIAEESPAIDAGKLLGIQFDYSGVAIPYGSGPDIGITEVMSVTTGLSSEKNIIEEGKDLSVYPNPSTGIFEVMVEETDNATMCPVQIRDLSGKILYSCYAYANGQGTLRSTINLSGVPQAMYLVQAIVNCKIITERIVIN